MADMRYGRNIHCALIVILEDQKALVDPGYCLSEPLILQTEYPAIIDTDVSTVRCAYDNKTDAFHLSTITNNEERWRYKFRDHPTGPEQFLKHWLASFRWNSMHGFCLTRVDNGRMIYIHKQFMRETRRDKKTNYRIQGQVPATIERIFNISPDIVGQAQKALEANLERERRLGLWTPEKSGRKSREK